MLRFTKTLSVADNTCFIKEKILCTLSCAEDFLTHLLLKFNAIAADDVSAHENDVCQVYLVVIIDINTGRCTRGKIPEETYRKINLEAGEEILRQLRLRLQQQLQKLLSQNQKLSSRFTGQSP